MTTSQPSLGFAYVGCFTTEKRRARGLGIEGYQTGNQPYPGDWTSVGRFEGLDNPSYLLSDPDRQVLYAVHGDGDHASAFAVDPSTGRLRSLGHAPTDGTNIVHLALDPSKRFLVVANYATGSVAVLSVRSDGALDPATQVLALPGTIGPHRTEQACAHPHHIVFDRSGRFVVVPDKGLDTVFVLAFEAGRLEIVQTLATRPGAGPRHIVFHPSRPLAFLVNELDSTVATLRWDEAAGRLTPKHIVSILRPDFFGASTAAAIVVTPCGRFVYASNRGQDGIARLALDDANGRLVVNGWTPSGGRDPRFMCLYPSGRHLLVANEQGDSLAAFAIDQESGDLSAIGTRPSLSPCAIAFL
jgi:6-phosphogluconolactonase (cycloisomerase 2 family)